MKEVEKIIKEEILTKLQEEYVIKDYEEKEKVRTLLDKVELEYDPEGYVDKMYLDALQYDVAISCYVKLKTSQKEIEAGVYDYDLTRCFVDALFNTSELDDNEYEEFVNYMSYYITAKMSNTLIRLADPNGDRILFYPSK